MKKKEHSETLRIAGLRISGKPVCGYRNNIFPALKINLDFANKKSILSYTRRQKNDQAKGCFDRPGSLATQNQVKAAGGEARDAVIGHDKPNP